MTLQETIQNDLKTALKEKNEVRLSVLRMATSAMKNKEIDKRGKGEEETLTEEEALAVLKSEVKKRRDAIAEFMKGERPELAEKESQELVVLESYLPEELGSEEIKNIVTEVVQKMGVVTAKDFGKVMGEAMKRMKGQASGDRVQTVVKELLQ